MEEIAKSMEHKRDWRGNVVFEPEVGAFDYIQGDYDLTDTTQAYTLKHGDSALQFK